MSDVVKLGSKRVPAFPVRVRIRPFERRLTSVWSPYAQGRGGDVDRLDVVLESTALPYGWKVLATREVFAIGVAVGGGIAVLAYRFAGTVDLVAWVWFTLTAVPLMLIDWICHRLPSQLIGAMFLGGIANFLCFSVAEGEVSSMFRAVGAAAVVFIGALATAIVAPGSLGGGDVKLLGTVALYLGWVGWTHVARGIVLALVLAAVVGGFLLATRGLAWTDRLAFGPAVIGGALIALVLP